MALNRENVIRAAEKYVSKGKLEAAIKEYRKVLAENPNDPNTLNRVGDLYARIQRFDEAVRLFSQIAEQYTRDGFFVKAIAIYKKIIKLDPTSLTVYERLAELYHKQGLLNEARTQYQVLADYYQKHDNAASAITIYQRMAEFEPDNPTFHLKLAELYESQRLLDKALREYRLLADLLIVGGSVDEAAQVYLKALEVNSDDLDFVRDAVSGLHDAGHVGEAAKVLGRAVELNPAAVELTRQVGLGPNDDVIDEQPAPDSQAPEPQDTSAFAASLGTDSGVFSTEGAFGADDAFDVPEQSYEDIQEALEDTAASAQEAADAIAVGAESDVFTFDLDDDEVPESLVTPPPDMLDAEVGSEDETFATEPEPRPSVTDEVAESQDDSIELELDWPSAEMEELDLADLPMVANEADIDLKEEGIEPDKAAIDLGESEIDLDETVAAHRSEAAEDFLELESFEIGEPSLEPVEHQGVETVPELEGELDIELEPMDFESLDLGLEVSAPATTVDQPDEEGDGLALGGRREEDLLAEAKVFAKYGLQEKARDRLSELFQVRPDHLEGLELQARVDLEAGQLADVMTHANLVSRLALEAGQAELWEGLESALIAAGFTIKNRRVVGEPGAKPVADDRIAQLLDDLSLDSFDAPVSSGSGRIPVPGRESEAPAEAPGSESAEAIGESEVAAAKDVVIVEEAAPEETASEEAAAAETVPEEAVLEETALEETVREETVPEEIEPEETVPAETAPAETVPEETVREETVPEEIVPEEKRPEEEATAVKTSTGADELVDLSQLVSGDPEIAEDVFAEDGATDETFTEGAPGQDVLEEATADKVIAVPDQPETVEASPATSKSEATQPSGGAAGGGKQLISLADELGLDELSDELGESRTDRSPSEVLAAADSSADPLDDTGGEMGWLDELETDSRTSVADDEAIFEEEDDFFDLAAELERELSEDAGEDGGLMQPQEQSLEDIIEGFKQGVAENLSAEDYDTHFNLGIAYREMGLLDEAIGEFQLAAKDDRYLVDSSSLLGICFLEKGLPELAVRSFRKGLESPMITADATMGLLYDMGAAYQTLGDSAAAYKTFVEVYGLNSHYRDVAEKVDELKAYS